MRRQNVLFGIHAQPPRWFKWVLILVPLIVVLGMYEHASMRYLAENPRGKLLPSFTMMAERFWALAAFAEVHVQWHGSIPVPEIAFVGNLLWSDTLISMIRFFVGLSLAAFVGLMLGLNIALFPGLQCLILVWVVALSFVPVVAVLPILLITLGIGEEAKISLIFLGLVFFITRDIVSTVKEVPHELLVKARTLGASELGLAYRVVLPMIMPRLLESVRLSLGPAWLFLITGEAIAAQQGLAYRIFLFRRVGPDMAGIIPYVLWITFLAFSIYALLVWAQKRLYPWKEGAST